MTDRFSHHEECPSCGSKDNLAVYSNGGGIVSPLTVAIT